MFGHSAHITLTMQIPPLFDNATACEHIHVVASALQAIQTSFLSSSTLIKPLALQHSLYLHAALVKWGMWTAEGLFRVNELGHDVHVTWGEHSYITTHTHTQTHYTHYMHTYIYIYIMVFPKQQNVGVSLSEGSAEETSNTAGAHLHHQKVDGHTKKG